MRVGQFNAMRKLSVCETESFYSYKWPSDFHKRMNGEVVFRQNFPRYFYYTTVTAEPGALCAPMIVASYGVMDERFIGLAKCA